MKHMGTVRIETMLLRKFSERDASAMFRNWASDHKVTEFLRWPAHESIETTKRVLNDWIRSYESSDFYQWAIVLKSNGDDPIGTIGVVDKNERLDMVHIGYCLGSKWWNQGITSEAFSAIIPFFFDVVGVNRIESQHDPNNPNSGRVMRNCGLRYEGTLRQADYSNKGIVDASIYSLLAREYYGQRGESGMNKRITLIRSGELATVDYAYASRVAADSNLLFMAGACPLNKEGVVPEGYDYVSQAKLCVHNLQVALKECNASLSDVVYTRVLVASNEQGDLVAVWRAVREEFGEHDVPSTLSGVTTLGYSSQLVEIEAVAAVQENQE